VAKRTYPLSRVYRLPEPGPVVLVTTAHKGRANIKGAFMVAGDTIKLPSRMK